MCTQNDIKPFMRFENADAYPFDALQHQMDMHLHFQIAFSRPPAIHGITVRATFMAPTIAAPTVR
jgi:hypothetical protein